MSEPKHPAAPDHAKPAGVQWEYFDGSPLLAMRLEVAYPNCAPNVFYDTCHNAMSVAKKLNVIVMVKMNDVDVMFFPDDSDIEAKVDAFKNAQSSGWASIA